MIYNLTLSIDTIDHKRLNDCSLRVRFKRDTDVYPLKDLTEMALMARNPSLRLRQAVQSEPSTGLENDPP